MLWTKIKAFFGKAWSSVRKFPAGAWFALLLMAAVIWYLVNRVRLQGQLSDIQLERRRNAEEKREAIDHTNKEELEELARIEEDYREREKILREEEAQLLEATGKGPSAIAKEWQSYWGTGK
jgi:hypothetical protein